MGTLNVLECAVKAGVRKVVYAASGGTIYGEPKRVPAKEIGRAGLPPASPVRHLEEGGRRLPGLLPALPGAGFHGARARQRLRAAPGPARRGRRDRDLRREDAGRARRRRSTATGTRPATTCSSTTSVHAFVQAMDRGSGKLVNIGTGLETSVNHLYKLLAGIIGFTAEPGHGPLPPGELRRIALDISSAPERDRLEAVDPPRGRAGRDRRVPEGHLSRPAVDPAPAPSR